MAQSVRQNEAPWLQEPPMSIGPNDRWLRITEKERRALEDLLEWAKDFPGDQQEHLRAVYQELA